jgi:hypothetical protein
VTENGKRRTTPKRLIPRVKRFTANGEDVWVATDAAVSNLEAAIEKVRGFFATGKANGWGGSLMFAIEAVFHELEDPYQK